MLNPARVTPVRFGRVHRHFIRCLNDKAIPIAAQDFMIGAIDERVYGPTHTHTWATSRSPSYAQPAALVAIQMEIAGNANWRVEAHQKARD
jgi:hypothetical protein